MVVIEWLGCRETSDYDIIKSLPEISRLREPNLILVRGPFGSGKSTLAKKLAKYFHTDDHYEADDWFWSYNTARKTYIYNFDGNELENAHDYCQWKIAHALACFSPFVICSNTNTDLWAMQPYFNMAETYNYHTTVINCRRQGQSIHNIFPDKLYKLHLKWEELAHGR